MDATALFHRLEPRGWNARVSPLSAVDALRYEIELRHQTGELDEEFFNECLSGFRFGPPEELPEARTLIVLALPQLAYRFTFAWEGRQVPAIVPPTYLGWRQLIHKVKNALTEALAPAGGQVARASLPEKLLAARSGLARYGRNNICYVEGMGSFHRLIAYATDLDLAREDLGEVQLLPTCKDCAVCQRGCPTGAITGDRFLLHAERCLTYHNEAPVDVPFPDWIKPDWHHCLVGCMTCQSVCPVNREYAGRYEHIADFTEEETSLLLSGVTKDDPLPAALATKIRGLDLDNYLKEMPRNLAALLCASGATGSL